MTSTAARCGGSCTRGVRMCRVQLTFLLQMGLVLSFVILGLATPLVTLQTSYLPSLSADAAAQYTLTQPGSVELAAFQWQLRYLFSTAESSSSGSANLTLFNFGPYGSSCSYQLWSHISTLAPFGKSTVALDATGDMEEVDAPRCGQLLTFASFHFVLVALFVAWAPLMFVLELRVASLRVSRGQTSDGPRERLLCLPERVEGMQSEDELGQRARRLVCLFSSLAVCSCCMLVVGAVVLLLGWHWAQGEGWGTTASVGSCMLTISAMYAGWAAVLLLQLLWLGWEVQEQLVLGGGLVPSLCSCACLSSTRHERLP